MISIGLEAPVKSEVGERKKACMLWHKGAKKQLGYVKYKQDML